MADLPEPRTPPEPKRGMTIYGRNGSPTVTLALPFSRVDVKADDALPAIAQLASLTARLARTLAASETTSAALTELAEIAGAADALASGISQSGRGRPE